VRLGYTRRVMVEGETSVKVNGKVLYLRREVLPYADVLRLAGYGPHAAAARPPVTVTYPKASGQVDGPLVPGEYAVVRTGMSIKVGA
jgi:hypothetical protein